MLKSLDTLYYSSLQSAMEIVVGGSVVQTSSEPTLGKDYLLPCCFFEAHQHLLVGCC